MANFSDIHWPETMPAWVRHRIMQSRFGAGHDVHNLCRVWYRYERLGLSAASEFIDEMERLEAKSQAAYERDIETAMRASAKADEVNWQKIMGELTVKGAGPTPKFKFPTKEW